MRRNKPHTVDSLLALIDKESQAPCWVWLGSPTSEGYGVVNWQGRRQPAHRVVYELLRGPLTDETADHTCRVRICVNPDHVRDLSNRENILIGEGPPAQNARKQRCYRGHEDWLLRTGPGGRTRRYCRTCRIQKEWRPRVMPTACPAGHPLIPENLYVSIRREGTIKRQCRTCTNMRSRGRSLPPASAPEGTKA